jgi:hypothetical protein
MVVCFFAAEFTISFFSKMDGVKWKCIECGKVENSREEDISILGESWVHLTQVMVPQEASSRWGNSSQEVAAHSKSGNVEGGGSMSEKVDERCKGRRELQVPEMCLEDAWETYPLCEECTHKVAAEIREAHDKALQESEMYIQQYEMLSQRLQEEEEESEEERRKLLREAEQEEEQLLAKSKAIEEAAISVRETVAELEKKGAALQQMHTTYWRDYNDLQLQLRSTDRDSLRRKIEATQLQVETLNQTNVINDAFHIAHTDTYATISGFRLGSVQVAIFPTKARMTMRTTARERGGLARLSSTPDFSRHISRTDTYAEKKITSFRPDTSQD